MDPIPSPGLDTAAAVAGLRGTRLFAELDEAALASLASACRAWSLAPGEALMREGELGDELCVVLGGRLEATQGVAGGGRLVLGEVRTGEFVGERALLERSPRMATVHAELPSHGLALPRSALEALAARHPEIDVALRAVAAERLEWSIRRRLRPPEAEILTRLERFTGPLPPAARARLADELRWTTLPRGAPLFRQGEVADDLYFVASGTLRVVATRADGCDVSLGEVGPGEPVGEMALLSGERRMATARAAADCELLRLTRRGFEELTKRSPASLALFARTMAARLARSARERAAVVSLRANPFVTLAECERAVASDDPVMLNLRITKLYHRIALDLTVLLGAQDVNWFGFACRASKTAGSVIRGEASALPGGARRSWLERLKQRTGAALAGTALVRRLDTALAEVSGRIAAGNRLIFAEIGPLFVRFVHAFAADGRRDPERLEALLAALRPGAPALGGQELLHGAVRAYFEAAGESDPKRRAEKILLGSFKIGLHEQVRVDPMIDEALDAPLRLLVTDLLGLLPGWLARRVEGPWRPRLTRWARRLITARLMCIRLPYGDLRLGEELPQLPARRLFPDLLATLDNPELAELYRRFDRGLPKRAIDWSEVDERMRYIVNLFRSRQKSLELFEPPFSAEQQRAIRAGELPEGEL